MWKDWLERTLTRRKAPAMLAAELCATAADRVEPAVIALPPQPARHDQEREPVEAR